ncbi:MAG: hypothetical protein WCT01_00200 [Candidatus Shapirobacteria bacterium]|jgi:hypothetical protein
MSSQVSLVSDYLKLLEEKSALDARLLALEENIDKFCRDNHLKTLRGSTHLIYVIRKIRTVFPSKSSPKRLELEKIIAAFPEGSKYSTLDILKLATAYDAGKLSNSLVTRLSSFITSKPYLKISLLPLKKAHRKSQ